MAKESRRDQSVDELKAEIARSRENVGRDLGALRQELDIPRKIRRSFHEQTGAWIAAALVVGALLVVLPARRKKVYVASKKKRGDDTSKLVETGFALGALRLVATLLKPVVIAFVTRKVRDYASEARFAGRS